MLNRLLCLMLIMSMSPAYWEDLSEDAQRQVLLSLDGHDILFNAYYEPSSIQDDGRLDLFLERVLAPDSMEEVLALKFYLLNQICICADGAIAEALPVTVIQFVFRHPHYVLSYLRDRSDLRSEYAFMVASELIYMSKGLSAVPFSEKLFIQRIMQECNCQEESRFIDDVIRLKNQLEDNDM